MSNNLQLGLANTDSHIHQILELQKKNLKAHISQSEIIEQGFVSIEHSFNILKKMNSPYGHTIAMEHGRVIAYALVMLPELRTEIPFLKDMFEHLEKLTYQEQGIKSSRYYVMGQICIDKPYRGMGLFQKLYNHQHQALSPYFDYCITEVSSQNKRSMSAHLKQGFEILDTHYDDEEIMWNVVIWNWRKENI